MSGKEGGAVEIGNLRIRCRKLETYLNFIIHHKRAIGRVNKLSHGSADVSNINPDRVLGGRTKFGNITPLRNHINIAEELIGALDGLKFSSRSFRKSLLSLTELSDTSYV